jgi:hypothetical protein
MDPPAERTIFVKDLFPNYLGVILSHYCPAFLAGRSEEEIHSFHKLESSSLFIKKHLILISLHRPFPFRRPVVYHVGAHNLYNVMNKEKNLSQSIWLNVVALEDHEPDVAANTRIHFYGLTHVNNTVHDSWNSTLHYVSETIQLSVQTVEQHTPISFKLALIPTEEDNDPRDTELKKYCTPSDNTEWVRLDGYEARNIWVLALNTINLVKIKETRPLPPLIITFTFPSITTLFDIMELEEQETERHHCKMINCLEFSLCPTTKEEPTNQPPHLHCMSKTCVRFWEMSTVPTNIQQT